MTRLISGPVMPTAVFAASGAAEAKRIGGHRRRLTAGSARRQRHRGRSETRPRFPHSCVRFHAVLSDIVTLHGDVTRWSFASTCRACASKRRYRAHEPLSARNYAGPDWLAGAAQGRLNTRSARCAATLSAHFHPLCGASTDRLGVTRSQDDHEGRDCAALRDLARRHFRQACGE